MGILKYTLVVVVASACLPHVAFSQRDADRIPTVQEAINARRDVWGELAMKQPNGPSYEFFEKLLPPLRYVSATFKHYPIVLSAPNGKVKARLVSNGSSVNALARTLTWRSEAGNPVIFYVGRDEEVFGEDLSRLDGPKYEKGYLPIVHNRYRHAGVTIEQEVFAGVEPPYSDSGMVFVSFKGARQVSCAPHNDYEYNYVSERRCYSRSFWRCGALVWQRVEMGTWRSAVGHTAISYSSYIACHSDCAS